MVVVHFVIMGCGRVGARLASTLDAAGHSVAVIDQDSKAFSRLSPDFSGRRVTGVGMDRDCLRQANIKDAYAFAAVSSGDNSNIIAARVAREVFHVEHVVARIYDPTRAYLYERLGIPTVASVQRTTESVMRRLLPPDASLIWSHPTGAVGLVNATPSPSWYGLSFHVVDQGDVVAVREQLQGDAAAHRSGSSNHNLHAHTSVLGGLANWSRSCVVSVPLIAKYS